MPPTAARLRPRSGALNLGLRCLLWAVVLWGVFFGRGALARCTEVPHAIGEQRPELKALAKGLWWVSAQRGDADANNRGHVSNLLLVRDGQRLWLVGSGPSPQWAERLRCELAQTVGTPVTDVISPWAHPELVLGAKAWDASHWAHEDVARQMREQCADCTRRLRQRLGAAAVDLGEQPVRWPKRLLLGAQGRLGPFEWHRLQRARQTPVTLWFLPQHGVLTTHGLVWAGGVPDLRDSRVDELIAGLQALQQVASRLKGRVVLVGEQGPPVPVAEVAHHLDYLRALQRTVARGQASGSDGVQPPAALDGLAPAQAHRLQDPTHALNWQRAWRQAEEMPAVSTRR